MSNRISAAIICDYPEEGWRAMDLIGDMLINHLQTNHGEEVKVTKVCPPFTTRASALPLARNMWLAKSADRFMNRFWDYGRWLKPRTNEFELFHIVDHSYAHLALDLPSHRTVVTCHDIDAFRCLVERGEETRNALFRTMCRRILRGLQRAAIVTCVSNYTRDELLAYQLVLPERLIVIPNGVHPACRPDADPSADAEAERLLKGPRCSVEILNVSSVRPRKRIDLLLRIFAELRSRIPGARLVRVGGPFTNEQNNLANRLNIGNSVTVLPFITARVLAALYRRADLVLLPTEREGFGLPLLEAMACGSSVVATDLPVLREIGGNAIAYRPLGEINAWVTAICELVCERRSDPNKRSARQIESLQRAAQFSWAEHSAKMLSVYQTLIRN